MDETSRRLRDINFYAHTEVIPAVYIFTFINHYGCKKYQTYLKLSVVELSKKISLVRRLKIVLKDSDRLIGLVCKTFMKDDDTGVLCTQRHVTDFWNSRNVNLHIPWPVVCR